MQAGLRQELLDLAGHVGDLLVGQFAVYRQGERFAGGQASFKSPLPRAREPAKVAIWPPFRHGACGASFYC